MRGTNADGSQWADGADAEAMLRDDLSHIFSTPQPSWVEARTLATGHVAWTVHVAVGASAADVFAAIDRAKEALAHTRDKGTQQAGARGSGIVGTR